MKAPKQNRDQNLIFEAYTNKQILNETAFAALMAVLRSSGPFAVKQALRVALKTKAVSPQWVASQSGKYGIDDAMVRSLTKTNPALLRAPAASTASRIPATLTSADDVAKASTELARYQDKLRKLGKTPAEIEKITRAQADKIDDAYAALKSAPKPATPAVPGAATPKPGAATPKPGTTTPAAPGAATPGRIERGIGGVADAATRLAPKIGQTFKAGQKVWDGGKWVVIPVGTTAAVGAGGYLIYTKSDDTVDRVLDRTVGPKSPEPETPVEQQERYTSRYNELIKKGMSHDEAHAATIDMLKGTGPKAPPKSDSVFSAIGKTYTKDDGKLDVGKIFKHGAVATGAGIAGKLAYDKVKSVIDDRKKKKEEEEAKKESLYTASYNPQQSKSGYDII